MTYTDIENIPGIMIFVDFEKAFDSIQWHYIEQGLKRVKFSPTFQKWFQILYNDVSSCVINNGRSASYFTLGRGVRQGDPLSAYLFIYRFRNVINCYQDK